MSLSAKELEQHVIRPTLEYLGVSSQSAIDQLLSSAQSESNCSLSHGANSSPDGVGLFQITPTSHREVWDKYLAFRPDLASKVRGLASQRLFLLKPDLELGSNLSYSTAIAWVITQYHRELH
ncbi:hypothetical protein SIN8267_00948 [Sinobacterium norvegicum]|uniref:Transglycosylase SLT domain-containing protein n=1 Tax=Sinobacterium norvegicum TaxID=1641715 RepID=A0ABM9ACC1_9GAMM|nr:hypothetical protein [Sinobacterium norvegicum]CAH0990848.1 hypothetical protein SIN8267_00948 [Sinobacterium norvegicum]